MTREYNARDMTAGPTEAAEAEDDEATLAIVREIFSEKIPFNKVLGVVIESLTFDSAKVRFDYRDDLVGNFVRGSLHGGVVSATLDLTGGLVAFVGALKTMEGGTPREKTARLANVGTIDLRVDYLRPGIGKHFIATSFILRAGNKVAVTRMELHNDEGEHIAVGTGAYLVG
jgi:uncharacterized protein (TIGR00369 family)